jgi:hypothetical protein
MCRSLPAASRGRRADRLIFSMILSLHKHSSLDCRTPIVILEGEGIMTTGGLR